MQQLKDFSKQITDALEKILPKKVRVAIVLGDPETSEVSVVSNMSDEATTSLIEDGVDVLAMPDEAGDLEDSSPNLKVN